MNDCKKSQALFAEALYEELNAEQKHFLKNHFQLCTGCKSEFAEMTSTLKVMDKRIRPEPEQGFWDDFRKRLVEKMEEEDISITKSESWWRSFGRALNSAPRWAFQATAALLLVIIGIYIGKVIFTNSVAETQQARQLPSIVSQPEPGIELIDRTQNYIERSKLILLALINFDPETEDPFALNLPYQKEVSRELVQEASYLKKELADSDQSRLESLITDLEVILLQISNLESEHDFEGIELVKEGMDSRGILLKIHFTDIRQRIKTTNETMPSKQTTNKRQTI